MYVKLQDLYYSILWAPCLWLPPTGLQASGQSWVVVCAGPQPLICTSGCCGKGKVGQHQGPVALPHGCHCWEKDSFDTTCNCPGSSELPTSPAVCSPFLGMAPVPGRMAATGLICVLFVCVCCVCMFVIARLIYFQILAALSGYSYYLKHAFASLPLPLLCSGKEVGESVEIIRAAACYPTEQSKYRVPLNLQNMLIRQNSNWKQCFTQGNSRGDVGGASWGKILLIQLSFKSSANCFLRML